MKAFKLSTTGTVFTAFMLHQWLKAFRPSSYMLMVNIIQQALLFAELSY